MWNDFLSSWWKLRASIAIATLAAAIAGGWSAAPSGDVAEDAVVAPPTSGASSEMAEGAVVTGRPHPSARKAAVEPSAIHSPPAKGDAGAVFKGLGAWIDLYDFGLDPRRTMRTLAANGVRTLYMQTGHTYTREAVDDRVGRWLVAAHASDVKVVGWYLPAYERWRWDAERITRIKRYSYRGHRFDGIGIDIENRKAVPRARVWSKRVAANFRYVRSKVGDEYPLAAIPPTPLQMRLIPSHWAGFPWKSLAHDSDAFLLMSYWSDRRGCPKIRRHCAYEFTRDNVLLTRRLTGDPDAVVHIIGGVGDRIDERQLWSFARAALDGGANGASIYDVATTRSAWWPILRNLRALD